MRPVSVTTVCGVLDKSGPLVGWAINQTVNYYKAALRPNEPYEETILEVIHQQAKRAAREVKQEAADIGTMAHNWLERYFKSGVVGDAPEHPKAGHCVDAALKWLHEHQVEKLEIERRIYSRKYKYSGTLDKLALVDGKKCLIDWKSSKGLYVEYLLQTSAYVAAYEEETGEHIEGRWLVKLGKEDGEFDAHYFDRATQDADFQAFTNALAILNYLKANEATF